MAEMVRRPMLCLAMSVAAAIGLLSSAAARTSHPTRTPYDGLWSVSIITDQGTCDRAYRYPVMIVNGIARHADADSSFRISGRVQGNGAVRVSVSRGDQRADGVGRLSRQFGSGLWRSARGECAGRWEAERRG